MVGLFNCATIYGDCSTIREMKEAIKSCLFKMLKNLKNIITAHLPPAND
jgi:Icc-related predicted phosphoesterase